MEFFDDSENLNEDSDDLFSFILILVAITVGILVSILILTYLNCHKSFGGYFCQLINSGCCRNDDNKNQSKIDKLLNQTPTQDQLEKSIDKFLKNNENAAGSNFDRDSNMKMKNNHEELKKEVPRKISFDERLRNLPKNKDEILKDEGVQIALRKIKDLAEKEKNKFRKSKVKIKSDNQDNETEEEDPKAKLKYKGEFKNINLSQSNVLIRETRKFEELNRDIKEILTDKRKQSD